MVLVMKSTPKNTQEVLEDASEGSNLMVLIIDGTLMEFDNENELVDYLSYKFDDKLFELYYHRCVEHYLDSCPSRDSST